MSVLKIKNGATWESIPAIKGEDGHTPIKGTDYWTAEDKAEIVDDVMDEVEPEIDSIRIYDTASGAIASFPDGADGVAVKSLVCDIEPVQDLHGYDNPWPAGGGKNKLNADVNVLKTINTHGTWNGNVYSDNGLTFTVEDDGSIKVNGTCSVTTYFELGNFETGSADYKLNGWNGTYTANFFLCGIAGTTWYSVQNADGRELPQSSSVRICIYVATNQEVSNSVFKPMIRLSSVSDATFAPYSNICPISGWTGANVFHSGEDTSDYDTLSISWQSEAGTVYGGTLDVTTGVLTVDRASITFDGTQSCFTNWQMFEDSSAWLYNPSVTPGIKNVTGAYELIMSNTLPSIPYAAIDGGVYGDNVGISLVGSADWGVAMRVPVVGLTTQTLVSEWLEEHPIFVVYALAEPVIYHLDPHEVRTLLGQNNIWADTGDSTVDYPADTKLYIQKMLS